MITDLEVVDSWSKIDVVSDEKRLIRTQPDNEPLMSSALIIVGQNFDDRTGTANLKITDSIVKCVL